MAARLGKEEAARLVLHWVVGGDLVGRLYPENVSLAKVPLLSMGGKLLQASKLHIWCINSLLNKCRPYITISGSLQPFKMVKIVPEKKCPRVPV